jgi:hypothetical protein
MVEVKDELNLTLSTKILSIAVLESFWILVAKFILCMKLYFVRNEFVFSVVLMEMVYIYVTTD